MNKLEKELTKEIELRRKNFINKTVLGIFLFIVAVVFIMKLIDGILIDYGYGIDKIMTDYKKNNPNDVIAQSYEHTGKSFTLNYWENQIILHVSNITIKNPSNPNITEYLIPPLHAMVARHPNFFWLLTQFTWITTLIVFLFIVFRLFKYESTIPSWLRWIMSQRTLSLITMYDIIVGVGFWSTMFSSFKDSFIPGLEALEYIITVIVHGIIPFAMLCYYLTYLIKDEKASILKELFIFKGLFYPFIYMCYYALISTIWNDPYQVSDLNHHFAAHVWKLPLVLLVLWISLGIMLLMHNFLLTRFNKKYDPRNDYEVIKRRDEKIAKLKRKTMRKISKNWNKDSLN